jgi:phosphoserine aminotransferase
VDVTEWVDFLVEDPSIRSCTSICLKIVDPWFTSLPEGERGPAAKKLTSLLEEEGAAYDVNSYRAAPPGLRIWGGSTVETSDLEDLFPWLDWAFDHVSSLGR